MENLILEFDPLALFDLWRRIVLHLPDHGNASLFKLVFAVLRSLTSRSRRLVMSGELLANCSS